jgi:three-Cys-motif partner protein
MPKVDFTNYLEREQAYVKHCLLEQYLPELTYRVGKKWDSIVYIDGFAGPWQTNDPDHADSSFAVAVDALRQCQTGLRDTHGREIHMKSILVEQQRDAYLELKRFASRESTTNFEIHALNGEFVDNISRIEKLIGSSTHNSFRFVFLDPKGWAQIPMRHLQSFLNNRSCEVLINLMTGHIIRFLDEPDRAESYHELFGRHEVLDLLRRAPYEQRTELAVQEYARSLRLLCNFKYASSAVILKPAEERIGYFLVYGTNHPRGVEVFKAAELKAARIQDEVRHEAHVRRTSQPSLLFDQAPPSSRISSELRRDYLRKAQDRVLNVLSSKRRLTEMLYEDILCEAMEYPLVAPDDLINWLEALKPDLEIQLAGTGRRKKPNALQGDRVVIKNPGGLRQTGKARISTTL